jgi:hypothetical protein
MGRARARGGRGRVDEEVGKGQGAGRGEGEREGRHRSFSLSLGTQQERWMSAGRRTRNASETAGHGIWKGFSLDHQHRLDNMATSTAAKTIRILTLPGYTQVGSHLPLFLLKRSIGADAIASAHTTWPECAHHVQEDGRRQEGSREEHRVW